MPFADAVRVCERAGLMLLTLLTLHSLRPNSLAAQTTPMTPSPPHEALSFFEGTWTIEEFPAEQGFVETCAWLPEGRRHMICRSRWRTATGPREGMSMFSYAPSDSTYLYYGLRAGGRAETQRGRRLADGWQFSSEVGSGATRARTRVTITKLAGSRFRLVEETSTGDAAWKADTIHYRPSTVPPR